MLEFRQGPELKGFLVFNYDFYDVVGSLGVLMIVGAYFLLMIRRIASTDLVYSASNAIGAALIIFSLSHDFNFAAFLMELFWLIISVAGIAMALRSRRQTT